MTELYHVVQLPLFIFKICPACIPPTEKYIDEFARDRTRPDGHAFYCKICNYVKIRSIQAKGTSAYEKKLVYNREFRGSHPEYQQQYRQQNIDAHRAQNLAYAKKHPEKCREAFMRRDALKKRTMVQKVDYDRILERDGMWCYICEKDILPHQKLHFDHVIPLDPRPGGPVGTHTEDNIKPTHSICNLRKHNRRFEDLTPYQRRGIN